MAYQYPLNGGRINANITGNTANAGTVISTGTVVFSGGNNVTLSQNGSTIGIAAGLSVSASNTGSNLASLSFGNANGVSFGLNGSVLTASHNALTTQNAQVISGSNGSFAFQTAIFTNSNGVSFGTTVTNGSSAMFGTVATSYAASNHSHGNPTLALTNLSGTTASASNGLTLSLSAAPGGAGSNTFGMSNLGNTAGTSGVISGSALQYFLAGGNNVTLSQSLNGSSATVSVVGPTFTTANNVTLGIAGGSVTGSASFSQSNQVLTMYAPGNATQNTTGTANASAVSLNGLGAMSVGYSGGSVQLSAPNVSSVSATGALSISSNGNTISMGVPAFSAGISSNSTVTNQLILAAGNNISLSQSTNATGATISVNATNVLTTQTVQTQNMVSINGSTGNISFGNAGNVSLGGNASTITASFSQTNQTLGINVTGNTIQSNTGTMDARQLTFNGLGNVSVGYSNGSIQISGSGGGGGGLALAGGGTTYSSGTASLNAVGGALTIASGAGQALNFSVPGTSSVVGVGAVNISTNGNSISISAPVFNFAIASNTAGTGGTVSNGLVLAGGNNVTLSQSTNGSGATVTIQAGGGGGGGGGVALYDGTNSISSGTANFSVGTNAALTISNNGQTVNFSAPALSSLSAVGGLTLQSNSNTISISAPSMSSLSVTGALSVSRNGTIVSIGAPLNGTLSNWEPELFQYANLITNQSTLYNNSSLYIHKLQPMAYINASQLMMLANISNTTTNAGGNSVSITLIAGIYVSTTGSSMSLMTQSSGSTVYGWNITSNNTASYNGMKGLSLPMNVSMVPGNYWIGIISRSATTGTSVGISNYAFSAAALNYAGVIGQSPLASQGLQEGVGVYSSSTSALPNAIPMGSIIQSSIRYIPYMAFKNTSW